MQTSELVEQERGEIDIGRGIYRSFTTKGTKGTKEDRKLRYKGHEGQEGMKERGAAEVCFAGGISVNVFSGPYTPDCHSRSNSLAGRPNALAMELHVPAPQVILQSTCDLTQVAGEAGWITEREVKPA